MNDYWIMTEHYRCRVCGKEDLRLVRVPYSKKDKPILRSYRHKYFYYVDCVSGHTNHEESDEQASDASKKENVEYRIQRHKQDGGSKQKRIAGHDKCEQVAFVLPEA